MSVSPLLATMDRPVPVTNAVAGILRDFIRPAALGSGWRDHEALGSLVKTVNESAGPVPVTNAVAGILRDFIRPAALGSGWRDHGLMSSALRKLLDDALLDADAGSTPPKPPAAQAVTREPTVQPFTLNEVAASASGKGEVYAALVTLVVAAAFVGWWFTEANRLGESVNSLNRYQAFWDLAELCDRMAAVYAAALIAIRRALDEPKG